MTRTTLTRVRRTQPADDSGSALVLALLVVLVVGSGLAVALEYTGVGLTLAPSVRDARNESNYVQGSVEGAINSIRGSSEAGRPLADSVTGCPTFTPQVPAGLTGVSGKVFTVECTGLNPGSVAGADSPRFAIHALAGGTGGIHQVGTDELYVNGGVYSNGVVEVTKTSASMRVNGTLTAEGSCSARITTTDPQGLNCSAGSSALGDDPRYESAIDGASAFTLDDVAAQSVNGPPDCVGGRIEFPAGFYSENPVDLVAAYEPTCGESVWHFAPGRYYFDYSGIWDLGTKKVVAGTVTTGWDDNDPLGGACDDTKPGVQFAFGGDSQIFTKSSAGAPTVGGLEICGPQAGHGWNGSPQRIALYGMSVNNDAGTGASGQVIFGAGSSVAASTANDSAGTAGWLQPNNALSIDGSNATTALTNKQKTATLDYGPVTLKSGTFPADAVVESVVLRSAHLTAADTTVLLEAQGMTPLPLDFTQATCATACTRDITADLDPTFLTPAKLATLEVTHKIERTGNVSGGLVDGYDIQVNYVMPALRALTCVDACTFFESDNNPNVFIHGTVYTPTADWEVDVHNSGETIFDRGIIMRDIEITMSTSSKQETSPFQLPSGTPNGRLVLFRGKVDGVEKVRACVRYADVAPSATGTESSAYAGYSLAVPRWLVMRTPSAQAAVCS